MSDEVCAICGGIGWIDGFGVASGGECSACHGYGRARTWDDDWIADEKRAKREVDR